jgi:GNAT superfamily N-acetyltransferase
VAVRPLDLSALPKELHELMATCHAEANAQEPYRSRADTEAYLRNPPDVEARDYWIAESSGDCIGFAQLGVLHGSPSGHAEILVRPDARRRGHGTALLAAVCKQAEVRGARVLIGSHATEPGSRFTAAVGAVDSKRAIRSLARLPLAESVRPRPVDGYTVQTWVGPVPDRLLESYAAARNAINDAPRPSGEEDVVWDAALVRDLEAALERRDRDMRVTVAVDERGEVVAFTELRVSRALGATAGTEDTAVVASHRRRGLGRWVKLESLRRLERDRPDVPLVATMNAEENRAMLELNRAVGFSPVAVYTSSVLQLPG